MKKTILGGLLALLTAACGGEAGPGQHGLDEPVANEAQAFTPPKGQIAFTARDDSTTADVFVSWGYIYYSSLLHTGDRFELVTKPSSYPKALTAVHIGGDPHVFWIDGTRVRGKRRNSLRGWEADFTVSSTSVAGGTLTRLVAVKGGALVGLTSNKRVVINWYSQGFLGWCELVWLPSALDDADLAAYAHGTTGLDYAVSGHQLSGQHTVFVGRTLNAAVCEPTLVHEEPLLAPVKDFIQRIAAARDSSTLLFEPKPDVYYLSDEGEIRDFNPPGETLGDAFSQPAEFRAFAHRARLHSGAVRDRFYAMDIDGNAWRSVETVRARPTDTADPNPEWQLMD